MEKSVSFSVSVAVAVAVSVSVAAPAAAGGKYDIQANLAKLRANPPGTEWSFAVLGDSRGGLNVLQAALGRIETLRPEFALYTGDLVGESTQTQWRDARAALDRTVRNVPVLPVVGNHETYAEGLGLFFEVFGNPSPDPAGPVDYSFDHGGARFVMMDNSRAGRYGPEGFTAAQISWLESRLRDAPGLVFVAAHKPPATKRWTHAFDTNSRAFMALLAKYGATAGLFGHIHLYDRLEQDGVAYIIAGGAGAPLYHWEGDTDAGNPRIFESPKGVKAHNFVIVTVKGERARFRTYTDQAKLAALRPKRSAGMELKPDDFELWESGELPAGRTARQPAGAGKN